MHPPRAAYCRTQADECTMRCSLKISGLRLGCLSVRMKHVHDFSMYRESGKGFSDAFCVYFSVVLERSWLNVCIIGRTCKCVD